MLHRKSFNLETWSPGVIFAQRFASVSLLGPTKRNNSAVKQRPCWNVEGQKVQQAANQYFSEAQTATMLTLHGCVLQHEPLYMQHKSLYFSSEVKRKKKKKKNL